MIPPKNLDRERLPTRQAPDRRAFLVGGGLGLATALTSRSSVAAGRSLYVFVVHDRRARAVENDLSGALAGVSVTVFGRIADFMDGVAKDRPDAILAPEPVLNSLGVAPEMRGLLDGKPTEQYAVLSQEEAGGRTPNSVGAVDLLGRRQMPELIRDLLSARDVPRVVRVARVEDLLPALAFNQADAVVLPERFVAGLKSRTSMRLSVSLPSQARMGCACVGGPGVSSLTSNLRGLPSAVLSLLGVDGWK